MEYRFTIKEISKAVNISADTLRYYDKIGLLSPKRGENKYLERQPKIGQN